MDALERQILNQLTSLCGVCPTADDSLRLIGIDSVGMAELTFDLEKQFNIRVDENVLDVETVGELVDYVRARVP